MRRFTVLGFTEAELGFVLAALFAAVAVGAVNESTNTLTIQSERDRAVAQRDSVSAQRDSAIRALALLGDSVKKLSNKTPRCSEKGEPPDAVADFRVLGANLYEWNGAQITWQAMRAQLAPVIAKSAALQCRYLVIARSVRGIDAVDHTAALDSVRRYFDIAVRAR